MSVLLSLVIPMYNVEKYIVRCLDSIFQENYDPSEVEIIIIDDGSTDKSYDITFDYSRNKGNIKLLKQPNGGASKARNVGLSIATGKFVWFIDSDDFIQNDAISVLLDEIRTESFDILTFNYLHPHENSKKIDKTVTNKKKILFNDAESFFCTHFSITNCSRIYKLDFLNTNNLRFVEGVIYEDQEFTPRALSYAKKIKIIPFFAYNHFHRGNSVTTRQMSNRTLHYIRVIDSLYRHKMKIQKGTSIEKWFDNRIAFLVSQAIKFDFEKQYLIEILGKEYYPLNLKHVKSIKELLKYILINKNIYLYYFLSGIYNKLR